MYNFFSSELTKEYGKGNADAIDAKVAYEEVVEACKLVESSVLKLVGTRPTSPFLRFRFLFLVSCRNVYAFLNNKQKQIK